MPRYDLCPRNDTKQQQDGENSPISHSQSTEKIGGLDRPILVAGIRVGVASPSRLGSQRTATPTVQGFLALLRLGVGFEDVLGFGARYKNNIALYKGLCRRYVQKLEVAHTFYAQPHFIQGDD